MKKFRKGLNNMEENIQEKINQLAGTIRNKLATYLYKNGPVIYGSRQDVMEEVNMYGESSINKSQEDIDWQKKIRIKVDNIVQNLNRNYENNDFIMLSFETMNGFFRLLNPQETLKELQEAQKQILCVNKDLKKLNFLFTEIANVEFETDMEIFKDKIMTDINEQIIKIREENEISFEEFKEIINESDYISSTKELIEYIKSQKVLDLSDLKEKINNFNVVTNDKYYEKELKLRIVDFIDMIEKNSDIQTYEPSKLKQDIIDEIKEMAMDYFIDTEGEEI